MEWNSEASWFINDYCSFDCIYCFSPRRKTIVGPRDPKKVVDAFERTRLKWLIHITGGEPFLYPNFVELCVGLSRNQIMSINTNLSHKNVFRFADVINPEKVKCIHCSLHIQERERLNLVEDFIRKYKYLEERGFYIFASYVLYPHLLSRFEKDYEYFKSKGIILMPKVFRGFCSRFKMFDMGFLRSIRDSTILKRIGRFLLYPDSYSKKQKDIIIRYIRQSQKDRDVDLWRLDLWLDESLIDGIPSFKGQYCNAGRRFIQMTPSGDVYRCSSESLYLGNLFEGKLKLLREPKRCMAEKCTSPYARYRNVYMSSPEMAI